MPIISDRLGTNPLHRMRNRIAAGILEEQWKVNYQVNKKYLTSASCITLDSLICDDPQCPCKVEPGIAVVVGAGPTLSKNLEDLGKYRFGRRPTFFCTDKAFPKLAKTLSPETTPEAPDYVLALNAKSPKGEVQGWWKSAPTKNSTLIMPLTADPIHLEDWNGKFCLVNVNLPIDLTDRITEETKIDPIPGGSNVGVFSYLMAAKLEFKTIVLLGMDYSFESREQVLGKYAPGEPYLVMEHRDKLGNVRWTSWDWFDSAIAFFEYARFFARNGGVRTINCTEGGIIYDDGEYIEEMTIKEATDALGE